MDMYRGIVNLLDKGRTGVLATLVTRAGSGARSVGTKMVITDQGETIGSLGGGVLDATIIHKAKEILQTGEPVLLSVEPERVGGEVCGSVVQVFLESLTHGPAVVVIGAGHVGRAVAGIARQAGFRVMLADDRTSDETGVDTIHCRPNAVFQDLPVFRATFIVICTRSHSLDYEVLKQALATPAEYIGLLGSRRKKESFFSRLEQFGIAEKDLVRIITPVGLDIGAQTPQEIGVSIVAQFIALFRESTVDQPESGSGSIAV
ncbi:MAG: XdhC family protein, partial [Deltaproteobacteria bacterium]|nr:XdhC family protein [Deltaproteobacteria bacterium]